MGLIEDLYADEGGSYWLDPHIQRLYREFPFLRISYSSRTALFGGRELV